MIKIMRKVAAVIVLRKDGKFVILKRSAKKDVHATLWNLPSGGIEKWETIEDASKREVVEETGLKIKDVIVGSSEIVDAGKYNLEINYVLAKTDSDQVMLNDENIEYKWIHPDESFDYRFAVPKEIVERVLKGFKLL